MVQEVVGSSPICHPQFLSKISCEGYFIKAFISKVYCLLVLESF